MSNAVASSEAIEIFLKSWNVYQDIIRHNYMFHREISKAVHATLLSLSTAPALRLLDLGCGDASMALPLLVDSSITAYIGCDLSQPALDIAHTQLAEHKIPHRLYCEDMLRFTAEQAEASIDLVIASYAIHHLNATDKQQLIREIARVLVPGGRFVLIDIFREPEEDRVDYIKHYMGTLRQSWSALSDDAQSLVVNHATEYDFPEPSSFYQTHCQKFGFTPGQRVAKHTWHEAWIFTH